MMETLILKAKEERVNLGVMERAELILKSGGLVAFPTETVYGLGADAFRESAAEKIYEAKGRPSDNPLIVHIHKMENLDMLAKTVPEKAKILAAEFWPGPLTMIFQKQPFVPLATTGGLNTVAVRMPSHKVARKVIEYGGGFIAAPSANTSGRPSPTKASHVIDDLMGKVDLIIDGGEVGIGVESTIIDMTVEPPAILRPGAVTKAMIEDKIGLVKGGGDEMMSQEEHPKAPGMKYKHYAPKGELTIVEGPIDAVVWKVNELSKQHSAEGKVGIIATDESVKKYHAEVIKSIGMRTDEEGIARNLYEILREFDDEGVRYIYSESFNVTGMGQAIMNRLLKAAGHHVIRV